MTTTNLINAHVRRAVMAVALTALVACAATPAALAVPPGPNAATAGASFGHPAGPC
jgi:hypothetical protein